MEVQNANSAQGFSCKRSMAKNGLNVRGDIVRCRKTVGSRRILCVPHEQKKCKIVSYIMKYLLSHIRTPFLLGSDIDL